jgi:hypothetical protein
MVLVSLDNLNCRFFGKAPISSKFRRFVKVIFKFLKTYCYNAEDDQNL